MIKNLLNFNNVRSALSVGIDILQIPKDSYVLVPEIICDVAVKVFIRKKIKITFYKLDKYFQPVWRELENLKTLKNKKISAILMVHFFGYPQNIRNFRKFSKKNDIYLIEDNCHSLNIPINQTILGYNGHIGIDSPRKIIKDLYSGGRLFINTKSNIITKNIPRYIPTKIQKFKKNLKKKNPKLSEYIKFSKKRPNYESPYFFSDKDNDFSIKKTDLLSLQKIRKFNFKKEIDKRYKYLLKLSKFAKKNNLEIVFKKNKNILPMHFVAITRNNSHRKKILNWGWRNKIDIVTWPSFYKEKKLSQVLLRRWNKYICIPLNQNLSDIDEKRI